MPRIDLQNVSKVFPLGMFDIVTTFKNIILGLPLVGGRERAKTAVDRVSLHFGSGERVGIIGQNGAGKSTLLHLIAEIASPTSGRISVEGHVTSVLTLGLGLREDLTGRENIYMDGELQGKSHEEVDVTIKEIIEFAELGEFIDRPIRTYSTGMKARLAFSMIALMDPEILLIDEALSVGDVGFSRKAAQRIREICAKGRVVVVVSHSLEAIREICTRCIWMEAGRVRMDGSPVEVTDAYGKSVQEIGEEELLAKFKRHIGEESFLAGWKVSALEFRQAGEPWVRSVPVGKAFSMYWCVRHPAGSQEFDLQLTVERLDGLLIIDEIFVCQGPQFGKSMIDQEIEIPPLLAHGVYRVEVSIRCKGTKVASRSSVLEVINPAPPRGGRPALSYPYTVNTV